jgi:hypothetical protein
VTAKNVSNLAASVQARLQNHARDTKRPFQELLQYYAMERFLYRLSTTPHRARFVLKGALMLHVWEAPLARATKDLDFLGRLDNSLENLDRVVREVCTADVEPDGMVFDPAMVKTERIKEDADYAGVRVRFVGLLGKARVTMQIDVGFGDVVTPGAVDITYPALLDFPAPALSGYPRETVIAEKFQAMVYLRTLNSRMKDFYDVWLLARQFAFDGAVLAKAIAATFANRETAIDVAPIAFTPEFTEQASTLAQWTAFRKKLPNTECPETLAEVVPLLASSCCRSRTPARPARASTGRAVGPAELATVRYTARPWTGGMPISARSVGKMLTTCSRSGRTLAVEESRASRTTKADSQGAPSRLQSPYIGTTRGEVRWATSSFSTAATSACP